MNGKQLLTFTIITAVFNRLNVIPDSIKSVNTQNYPPELIQRVFIDGESTDGTLEYLKSIKLDKDVLISESDGGIYNALNKGLSYASGDILAILHSDDFYMDRNVLRDVAEVFSDPCISLIYGDLEYVSGGNESKVIRYWMAGAFDKSLLRWGWMPPHPTLFIRRSMIDELGGFDEAYKISADYDFMVRYFSKKFIGVFYIKRVLVRMRVGGVSNGSIKNLILKTKEDYRIIKNANISSNVLFTIFWKNFSKLKQFLI